MKPAHFLPALVLGCLGGWLLRSLWTDPALPPGNVLTAAVTLLVGWVLQRAIRQQGELDKVPLESLARLCQRIESLIIAAVDRPADTQSEDRDLLQKLRVLSNEILWLTSIVEALRIECTQHTDLRAGYLVLKRR